MARTAFVNARLLDPETGLDAPGGLLVEDGRIAELAPGMFADGAPEDAEVIDCAGHCLAPGLIDLRVHIGEPGEEHKETIETASSAAAAGGVTTLVCQPDTNPPIDDPALVESILRQARAVSDVAILPCAAVTRGLEGDDLAELGLLAEAGAVAFSNAGHSIASARTLRRALSYAADIGLPVSHHLQDPSLAHDAAMNEGETATRLGLAGVPAQAETMMVERDMRIVELAGGRWHSSPLSTADALDAIRQAKARGLPVTAETAPPYFDLNETAVGDYRTFAKLSPPLRSEEDRLAVIDALADGTLDIIVSDHTPQDVEEKRLPFAQAAPGGVGLETLLPISLNLVHGGALGLLDLLAKLTANPARLLGLDAGRLAPGAPADMVLFDLGRGWKIDDDKLRSKSKNTPFDGRPVQGKVLRTVAAGRTVYDAS